MRILQNYVFPAFLSFCAVFIMAACSPDDDTKIPTTTIIISGVPQTMIRTIADSSGANYDRSAPTYKAYVQLSAGTTASAGAVASGEALVKNSTVTIKLNKAVVAWSNMAFVICPEKVDDIFDIDAKASMSGPSDSPIVHVDWRAMLPRSMLALSGGVANYRQLYGEAGDGRGVVVLDPNIKRYSAGTCECDPGDPGAPHGASCLRPARAKPSDITNMNQFRKVNGNS